MTPKRTAFGWNGGARPRPPSEGFATSVGVAMGSVGLPAAPDAPASAGLPEGAIGSDGPQVDVRRLGEPAGPEVTRPSGRIRLVPG